MNFHLNWLGMEFTAYRGEMNDRSSANIILRYMKHIAVLRLAHNN